MKQKDFTHHQGVTAAFDIDNVDTDQIIPSREIKAVSREGLSEGLFAGWRYLSSEKREPKPDFLLNQKRYASTSILVFGENFGCGSSREQAVWALKEYGIRAIIAESFGEIFHGNCVRNGLLTIQLSKAEINQFTNHLNLSPAPPQLSINLLQQTVSSIDNGLSFSFDIGAYSKRLLVEGLDPISLTLQRVNDIERFLVSDKQMRPWVYPH